MYESLISLPDFNIPADKAPSGSSPLDQALAQEGVSGSLAEIARSVYQQESGSGRNSKTSNAGARGGMQIIPTTFTSVADKDWNIDDPVQNARAGIRYLGQLYKQADGDPALTAAGYYGGPGGLEKARLGVAVSDPRNPQAPNTLQYGQQVAGRLSKDAAVASSKAPQATVDEPYYVPVRGRYSSLISAPPLNATVGDYGKELAASAIDAVGAMGQMVGEGGAYLANKASGTEDYQGKNLLKGSSGAVRDSMTEGGKQAAQDANVQGSVADLFTGKSELPSSFGGIVMMTANGLGSMAPMLIPGIGWAAKAARATKAAEELAVVAKASGLAADALKAEQAIAAVQAISTTSRVGGGLLGGAMTGGAAAGDVRDSAAKTISGKTHDELMQVPAYAEIYGATGDESQARQGVVNSAARLAGVLSGLAGAAGGVFNSRIIEDFMVHKGISSIIGNSTASRLGRSAISGVGLGVAEGGQEVTEKIGQNAGENIALGRPADDQIMRNTGGDFLGGALVGGHLGAIGGLSTRHTTGANPVAAPVVAPEITPVAAALAQRQATLAPVQAAADAGGTLSKAAIAGSTGAAADAEFEQQFNQAATENEAANAINTVATGQTDPSAPVEDPLAERVQSVVSNAKTNNTLDALRHEQSPIPAKQFVNDLAIAQSVSTTPALREQALSRLEYAAEWATSNPAPTVASGVEQIVQPDTESLPDDTAAPLSPQELAQARTAAQELLRGTDLTDVDRSTLTSSLAIADNPALPQATRDQARSAAHEVIGRNLVQQADARDKNAAPAALTQATPAPVGSPEEMLEQAGRNEANATDLAAMGYPQEAATHLDQAALMREEAKVRAQDAIEKEAADSAATRAIIESDGINVAAPKVVTPAGKDPAILRKRRATLTQLIADGLNTVERRHDGNFYLVNANRRRQFMLDGPADAQLARKARHDHIEAAANQANGNPTPAQAQAENYKIGRVEFDGLPLGTENPIGSDRKGVAPDGTPWKVTMSAHYGRVLGTLGADGSGIDFYLAKNPRPGSPVFVIDQYDGDKFDETKSILGVPTQAQAEVIYDAHFSDGSGPMRRGAVTAMSAVDFKAWAHSPAGAKAAGAPSTQTAAYPAVLAHAANQSITIRMNGQQRQVTLVQPAANDGSVKRDGHLQLVGQENAGILQAIGQLFNTQVSFFQDDQIGDGFFDPSRPGQIFLNELNSISPLAVFGHEFWHHLKQDMPEVHAAVMQVVGQHLTPDAAHQFRNDYYKADAGPNSNSTLNDSEMNELTSDIGGNLMTDAKFWADVFAQVEASTPGKSRGIIAQFAAYLDQLITQLLATIKQSNFRSTEMVADMEKVRASFKDGVAQYILDNGIGKAGMQAQILKATQESKKAASRSDAEIIASAERAGFDGKRWYHGTVARDFKEFKAGKGGVNELGEGIYLTGRPEYAQSWAGRLDMGGRVMPVLLKKGDLFDLGAKRDNLALARRIKKNNPLSDLELQAQSIRDAKPSVLQWTPEESRIINDTSSELWRSWLHVSNAALAQRIKETPNYLNSWLKHAGYIGAINENSQIPDQVVVFDAKNIRSPWAKFNPKKAESGNILASAAREEFDANQPADSAEQAQADTQTIATETPEFKAWFKDSKVVDADGNPQVMYHGTYGDFDTFKRRTGDIGLHFGDSETASDRVATAVPHRGNKDGKTLSASVMPVYLSIKNPIRLTDHGFWNAENMKGSLLKMFPQDAARIGPPYGNKGLSSTKDIREYLESKGFDGVIYKNTGEVTGSAPFRERIATAREAMNAIFPKGKNSFDLEDQKVPEYVAWSQAEKEYKEHRYTAGTDSYIAFRPTQIKSAIGNNGAFDPASKDITRSAERAPEHRLSSLHSLSEANLIYADKMGGLAVPSIGVVKEGMGMSGFGNITLIGGQSLADPALHPVYSADAYAPRWPAPEYNRVKWDIVKPLMDEVKPFEDRFDNSSPGESLNQYAYLKADPGRVVSDWLRDNAIKAMYLAQRGINVKPVYQPVAPSVPFAHMPAWISFSKTADWTRLYGDSDQAGTDTLMADATVAAKQALDEYLNAKGRTEEALKSLRSSLIDTYFNDDGVISFGYLNRMASDAKMIGTQRVASTKTGELLDKKIGKHLEDFKSWVESRVLPMYGSPFLTVSRSKVPYTIGNIADVMMGSVVGQEKTMTYGPGQVRAATSSKLSNLQHMRNASYQMAPRAEYEASKKLTEELLSAFRSDVAEHYADGDTWGAMDASMRAVASTIKRGISPAALRTALSAKGFRNVPAAVIERGVAATHALREAPVPYFEAKPQRVVTLDEFHGAVVPRGLGQAAKAVLQKHDIKSRTYDPDIEGDRDSATNKLRAALAKAGKDVLFSKQRQTETPEFKRWSNDAPLITSVDAAVHEFRSGEKVVVEAFHGTGRADRVGAVFQKKRATSGPMAFHTSDPSLASGYAQGKPDTSLALEDNPYQNWFKYQPQGQRSAVAIDRSWYSLSAEQKATIAERLPDIRQDDDMNIIYEKGGGDIGSYEWNLQQTQRGYDKRGNPLAAAVETWLNSGAIFGEEKDFMQVLKLAGFPVQDVNFDHPHETFPFVYKNYIAMQNPLVVSDIPQRVVEALDAAARTDRSRAHPIGADSWDKNIRTLKEWVAAFHGTESEYVWTSIPDKVTKVLAELGYDGIIDQSGKGGGDQHPVYIPFTEDQIKSAMGNNGKFEHARNILKSQAREPSAARISESDKVELRKRVSLLKALQKCLG